MEPVQASPSDTQLRVPRPYLTRPAPSVLPLISFETGRRTQTQSPGQLQKLRQQMEVWFSQKEEPRPRGPHTRRRIRKNLHPCSSGSASGDFLPLDKDLSWKSYQHLRQATLPLGDFFCLPLAVVRPPSIGRARQFQKEGERFAFEGDTLLVHRLLQLTKLS